MARQWALDEIAGRGSHTLNLVVENLRGELAKQRYQPRLLATNPAFLTVLKGQADAGLIAVVNQELERTNAVSGALDTYLMDRSGLTVAASNWSSARPFIGRNFSYRPYFKAAMEGRLGRYFALGTTSGERGYYFAYPVRDGNEAAGALVVKMSVGHLEAGWRTADHEIVVTDPDGVIFLSSNPAWRLRTLAPLTPTAINRVREDRRYGKKPLLPLKTSVTTISGSPHRIMRVGTPAADEKPNAAGAVFKNYLMQQVEMADAGWRVALLADTRDVARQVNTAIVVAGLLMASLLLAAANIYQRRRRLAERIATQETAKTELELRVQERTRELSGANIKLRTEIEERLRTEGELRRAQSDLVQATKLAALGQMSAGLSHELNQPLAAIRTYADNARTLLERGLEPETRRNLSGISELTERMARIINNLRTYARNETVATRPTSLRAAIEGATNLLEQRIKAQDVTVDTKLPPDDILVIGGDVRLQQVFVNLIANALDALEGCDRKEIHLDFAVEGRQAAVTVRDTGPGIGREKMAKVFDPFFSTKGVGKGLGLGLSITYGIINQFGGSIEAGNHPDGGAIFTVRLVNAAAEHDKTRKGEAA